MYLSRAWLSAVTMISLALCAGDARADGYVLGLGFDADSADGRAVTAFGDFGIAKDTWLSATFSANQVDGVFETRETAFADLSVDHWFDPVGVRFGASYWGNKDILESVDYNASIYFRGESSMLSLNYERREFDFIVLADSPTLRRTAEFSADGIGLNSRLPLGDRANLHFGAIAYDYSRNIRIQPNIDVLRFLSSSRLSMINSLIDHRVHGGIEFKFGLRSLDLSAGSWQTAVDGGRVDSYSIGYLTPVSDRMDIELRLSYDDSENFGKTTALSAYFYFFGGS